MVKEPKIYRMCNRQMLTIPDYHEYLYINVIRIYAHMDNK